MAKIYSAPDSIPVPEFSFSKIDSWKQMEEEYLKKLKEYCLTNSKDPSKLYVGEEVSIPMADGYARYMVLSLSPKVELVHIALGDAWDSDMADLLTKKRII